MLIYTILLGSILLISVGVNVAQAFIIKAGLRRENKLTNSLIGLKFLFGSCLNEMRNIDNRQMFEKDDDVGVVFEKLKETIYKTNEEIEKYQEKQ